MLRKYRIKKVDRGSILKPEFRVQVKILFFWITIKKFVDGNPEIAFGNAELYVFEHMDLDDDYYGCQ